jgi:hypothetical protein
MYSNYPQLENVVKYFGDAVAASVIVAVIWEILRGGCSRRFWTLIRWLLTANQALLLVVYFVYGPWRAWRIGFLIQCAAVFVVLMLSIRRRKAAHSRWANAPLRPRGRFLHGLGG